MYRRILVYGVTGSGKSTLAKEVGRRLSLPVHSVDDLTYDANWQMVPADRQQVIFSEICAQESWVLDSAYGTWLDVPLGRAEAIVCWTTRELSAFSG